MGCCNDAVEIEATVCTHGHENQLSNQFQEMGNSDSLAGCLRQLSVCAASWPWWALSDTVSWQPVHNPTS